MQYNNVTWCWCAELYRRHRGMAGRQASTLPILREMNEGGKNSYVASRCAHESENVHFDDGNVASGRWQSNTCAHKLGSVLTNRTKGMQTRLRACSLRAVRLCCVQWKWKMCSFFFFAFSKYGKGPRASAFAFACCPLLHPLLQFSVSFLVGAAARSLFFEKCSHMLATDERAHQSTRAVELAEWCSVSPASRCHTFRINNLFIYDSYHMRTGERMFSTWFAASPDFNNNKKTKLDFSLGSGRKIVWMHIQIATTMHTGQGNEVRGRAHGKYMRAFIITSVFGWTKSRKNLYRYESVPCVACLQCTQFTIGCSECVFMFVSSFHYMHLRCRRLTHTHRRRERRKKSDKKIWKKSQRKCVCKYWDD